MLVTVAICTWNRAALLDRTLAALDDLRVPPGVEWELLVVDNNSTDDTRAVLARHAAAGRLPLRPLFEPRQGLSHARNCAVADARGELLAWTDDDVIADPMWLAEYTRAAREWPQASFFGGTIEPWYETAPPQWIERYAWRFEGMLVLRQMADPEGESDHLFFGANMAFRAEILRRHPFDISLGVTGAVRLGGEETHFMHLLRRDGHVGVWVPSARVRHFTPTARLRPRYVWRYFVGLGRTDTRLAQKNEQAGDRPFGLPGGRGVPRFVYRALVTDLFHAAWRAARRRRDWVPPFVTAAHRWGVLTELRAAARGAK